MTAEQKQLDPLAQITSTFPRSIKIKRGGHLLEFCPDETCDGFVASTDVNTTSLKDFAYLYIYFFSDYIYLDEWRTKDSAKSAATLLLAKPEYQNCRNPNSRDAARCVLRELSRSHKIKLVFIRYDENYRSEQQENLEEKLTQVNSAEQK